MRRLALLLFVVSLAERAAAAPPEPPKAEPRAQPPSALDTWGLEEEPEPARPAEPPPAPPATPAPCPCGTGDPDAENDVVRYTLQAIDVRGNTRTSRRVVMRYLPFKPGQVLDPNDLAFELARYRLLGTGFFRQVELSLEKGTRRGLVVLVVEVAERNTIVLNDVYLGLSKDAETQGPDKGEKQPLTAYAGIDVAETNLGGSGITLGGAAAVAQDQLALRARFFDPAFVGASWMVAGTLLYNNANDYFGNSDVIWADPSRDTQVTDFAVVNYRRFGGSLGIGRDLSVPTQVWLHYRLETIDASYPLIASHQRGLDREPIDFSVIRGRSVLSTVRMILQHDTRDHPFLPTRGWFGTVSAELALLPAALDYDFQKVELRLSHWWQLPWQKHVLELEAFAGAIAGDAPFFEQFYVGDFTDFLPDRVLGMNFDRRPPPNVLATSIAEERYGQYALSLGLEYRIPLYRGHRSIYGIDLFASGGVYGVAGRRSFTDPANGYDGFARIPIDLTGNLGFRIDTSAGGFTFAFANALGFIPEGTGR